MRLFLGWCFKRVGVLRKKSTGEYALIMFIGLMIYGIFSESVLRSATIIVGHTNYVKKVVFPLEILPQMLVLSAVIQSIIALIVWYAFFIILLGVPPISGVLYVIVLISLMIMSLGVAYFFAALGVYFRDLSQLLGIVIPAIMFLSPIFYPRDALPQMAQDILPFVNPIAIPIEQARNVLVHGKLLNPIQMGGYFLVALIFLLLGLSVFKVTRRGFSDVL